MTTGNFQIIRTKLSLSGTDGLTKLLGHGSTKISYIGQRSGLTESEVLLQGRL
jgi:hypothetical protein